MTISTLPVDTIPLTPSAQAVRDALSVSPHMDHVVNIWMAAHGAYLAAQAVSDYANANKSIFEAADTTGVYEARKLFHAAHAEMLERWKEYKAKDG